MPTAVFTAAQIPICGLLHAEIRKPGSASGNGGVCPQGNGVSVDAAPRQVPVQAPAPVPAPPEVIEQAAGSVLDVPQLNTRASSVPSSRPTSRHPSKRDGSGIPAGPVAAAAAAVPAPSPPAPACSSYQQHAAPATSTWQHAGQVAARRQPGGPTAQLRQPQGWDAATASSSSGAGICTSNCTSNCCPLQHVPRQRKA